MNNSCHIKNMKRTIVIFVDTLVSSFVVDVLFYLLWVNVAQSHVYPAFWCTSMETSGHSLLYTHYNNLLTLDLIRYIFVVKGLFTRLTHHTLDLISIVQLPLDLSHIVRRMDSTIGINIVYSHANWKRPGLNHIKNNNNNNRVPTRLVISS